MIKIPENIMKFSKPDIVDCWVDYFNHYRSDNNTNPLKKFSYDTTKTFEKKTKTLNQAINFEVNKIAGINSTDIVSDAIFKTSPQYQWASFAVVNSLIDMVIPDVIMDAYGQFSEIRNVSWGDSPVFDIKSSDLFYITKNGNNRRHVTAQRQFTGQTYLIPENHSITVETDLYRVLCGKENLAEYAIKVALSMSNEIAYDIYAALSGAYSTRTTNFREAAFTSASFVKLANRVSGANGGGKAYCYGTNIALSSILPTNDYLKMQLGEKYNQVGYLPVFMNTSLIALPSKIDWDSADYEFSTSDTELFIINTPSQSIVKCVIEGDALNVTDQGFTPNLTQRSTLHKRWKVGVVTNSKFGVIHL